ncbi:MAG: hypothetical protein ACOC58_00195 [Chloroflexota bacterium]
MNLKFKEVSWDGKGLMYVSFDKNGEVSNWYPGWKDLFEIWDSAWATEHGLNSGKWMAYLTFTNLVLLTRYTLIRETDHKLLVEFNELADRIQEDIRSKLKTMRSPRKRRGTSRTRRVRR